MAGSDVNSSDQKAIRGKLLFPMSIETFLDCSFLPPSEAAPVDKPVLPELAGNGLPWLAST